MIFCDDRFQVFGNILERRYRFASILGGDVSIRTPLLRRSAARAARRHSLLHPHLPGAVGAVAALGLIAVFLAGPRFGLKL